MSIIPIILLFVFAIMPLNAGAFDPGSHFEKSCSGCHTIGGGTLVGPDLKGVTERRKKDWLISFIQSPGKKIKSGDSIAVEMFNKFFQVTMPDQDLTNEEAEALLDFISKGGVAETPIEGKSAAQATEEDIAKGHDLFVGRIPFAKGAPACIACHSAGDSGPLGGGTLGVNLTQVYSKYGDNSLSMALKKPGFRIMNEIFEKKPLEEEEIFALKAFLYSTDRKEEAGGDYGRRFVFLGIGGGVMMLGVTDFLWRKRRRKSTKPWLGRIS